MRTQTNITVRRRLVLSEAKDAVTEILE